MAYNLPMQINLQAPASDNIGKIKKSIENGLKHITIGNPTKNNLAEIRRFIAESFNKARKVKLQIDPPSKANLKLIRATIEQSLSGIKIQGLGLDPKSIKATGIAQAKIIEAQGKAAAKLAEAKKPKSRTENEAIRRESTARARATASGAKAKNEVTKKIGTAKAKVAPEIEIAKSEAEIRNKNKMTNARILAAKKREEANEVRKNQKLAADLQSKQLKDAAKISNDAKMTQAKENALKIREQAKAASDAKVAQAKADAIALRAQTQANKGSGGGGRGGAGGAGGGDNEKKIGGIIGAIEGKVKSFAAYAVVSTAFLKLSGAISNATQEAMNFERELINIAQTTGDSVSLTKDYSSSLIEISKTYNVTLTKAAQLTRIIAQTGLEFKESAKAAEILARTSLLAGFDSLTDTTEGFIAVMNTFNISVTRAGQVLESINVLSKKYAVESGDLVEAIKRTGGAFSSAGGNIEELLALITAVRSTTRESAETISTGFRTIFARLQRPKTIEFFKQLGIQLETSEGQFIGPFQAIKAINDGLAKLNITVGSTEFAKVVEEIGGIRQISKVVPLLIEASLAQEALDRALEGKSQSFEDLQKAQQGLGYQLGVLQKQFSALVAEVVDSSGFKILADVFINISKAVLGFASALSTALPLLTTVGAAMAGRALGQTLQGKGFANAFGQQNRAKRRQERRGFASGGFVPGSGSGDTVPAMLTPGEFVIKKSSAQSFGYDNLAKINKYASGGQVSSPFPAKGGLDQSRKLLSDKYPEFAFRLNPRSNGFGYRMLARKVSEPETTDNLAFELIKNLSQVEPTAAMMVEELNQKFVKQGTVGTDTIPAMLTPGEFVVNKKSARAFGYGNLESVNKYAKGGVVEGIQKFAKGGAVNPVRQKYEDQQSAARMAELIVGIDPADLDIIQKAADKQGVSLIEFAKALAENTNEFIKQKNAESKDPILAKALGALVAFGKTDDLSKPANKNVKDNINQGQRILNAVRILANRVTGREKQQAKTRTGPAGQKGGGSNIPKGGYVGPQIAGIKDLVDGLNAVGKDLDPNVVKNLTIRLERISKTVEIAQQDYAKKAKAYNDSIDKATGQGDAILKAMALGARNRLIKTRQSAKERTTQAITKAAQSGLPTDLGLSISEILTQADRLDKGIKKATENVKLAIDEENKAIDEERKAKARAIKDLMDSPSFLPGNSRRERIKEAQNLVKQNEPTEVVNARKKREEASRKREQAESVQEGALTQASAFSGTKGILTGYKPPVPPTVPPTIIQKTTAAFTKLYKSAEKLNLTYIEAAVYAQTLASSLSAAGMKINQSALTSATIKGGAFSTAADTLALASSRKNIFLFGKLIGKLPGPIGQFGAKLTQQTGKIALAGKALAKGLTAASFVEIFGGVFDSIFSIDYESQKQAAIASGDADSAAAAAAKQYAQAQVRSIPLIGGFLSGLRAGALATEDNIDANGKLVVATVKAAAQINKVAEETLRLEKQLADANLEIDPAKRSQKQQEVVQSQLDLTDTLTESQRDIQEKRQAATGASIGDSISKGMVAGAGTAAIGAAVSGGTLAIPAAVTGLVVGLGTAAVDYWLQLRKSTEDIVNSYEEESNLIKAAGEIQSKLIDNFGNRLKAATVASVRAGGGYKEALDKITQQYGGQLNEVLGGFSLTGNLSSDIETITRKANDLRDTVKVLERERNRMPESNKEERAAKQTEIDRVKQLQDAAEKTKEALQQTYYAEAAEKALAERRAIQAKAIEYQLKIMREMESAYDGFNAALRNSKSIMEEIGNVGTGKLSTRQVAGRYGINKDVFEMDARDILRAGRVGPRSTARQVADLATKAGAPGLEIQKSMGRLNVLDAVGAMTRNRSLGDILKNQGEEAVDPKEIQKTIYQQLAAQGYDIKQGVDPALDEALRVYSEKIAEGYENAGVAENEAREAATKEAEAIIGKQQEKLKEYFAAEQQLREYEIELTNKRMGLAKQSYDNEKDYFEERLALTKKVRDALTVEPTGKGRAGFVANRAAADRAAQMAGLNARRAQGFAGAGLGGANRSRAVQEVSGDVKMLGAMARAGLDVGTAFETLDGTTNMLISTIRDEIEIENQYLDGLIESAKAQQEYTQSLYDAQGAIVRDLVTGTDEDVRNQLASLNAAAMAAQQGSFAGIPENMKKDIFGIFDQFADVEIPGLGKTGRQAQKEITKNEMMRRFGVDAATAEQLASKAVQDRVPVDQRMAEQIENQKRIVEGLLAEEKLMKNAQLDKERIATDLFAAKVNDFAASVNEMMNRLNLPANPQNQPQAALPPQAPQVLVENTKQENQPIQIVANGQQQFTVSLPDIQALVNQNITAMIFQTISQTFNNMAEGVRTAQNFEDMANLIANASKQTTTQNIGGQA